MSQLPVLPGKEIIRLLKSIGFKEVSCKGSHVKLKGYCETRWVNGRFLLDTNVIIALFKGDATVQENLARAGGNLRIEATG